MTDTYELPEPVGWVVRYPNGDEAVTGWPALGCEKLSAVYTADQVRLAVKAERERADGYREALAMIAAQGSANPGSTSRVDCMAALAAAAIRKG